MMQGFNFSTEVRVRLPETDAMGIVFNGSFFTYFEVGRMDYFNNLGLFENYAQPIKGFQSVVRSTKCDFESPARVNESLVIYVRVAEIKNSSFRFEFVLYHKKDNRLVAKGDSVHVALDAQSWKPVRVPEEFREAIRKYEGPSLVELGQKS